MAQHGDLVNAVKSKKMKKSKKIQTHLCRLLFEKKGARLQHSFRYARYCSSGGDFLLHHFFPPNLRGALERCACKAMVLVHLPPLFSFSCLRSRNNEGSLMSLHENIFISRTKGAFLLFCRVLVKAGPSCSVRLSISDFGSESEGAISSSSNDPWCSSSRKLAHYSCSELASWTAIDEASSCASFIIQPSLFLLNK